TVPRDPPRRAARAPRAAQLVVLRAAVVLGITPFRRHPAVLFEPVQGGVEGAFLDQHVAVRHHAHPLSDGVAVAPAPGEGLENEKVESAAEEAAVAIEHDWCPLPSCLEGSGRLPL